MMGTMMQLSDTDEATAMLARMMYVHHQEFRSKDVRPVPFAPEWAFDYARICVAYLAIDESGLEDLRGDYR